MRVKTQNFALKYTRLYICVYNSVIPINIMLLQCDTASSRCLGERKEKKGKEKRLNGVAVLFRAKELFTADESAKLTEWRIRAVTLSLFQMMPVS